MKKNILKTIILVLVVGVIGVGALFYSQKSADSDNAEQPDAKRPASFQMPVPFTTQAPLNQWVDNKNCEEAAAVMASMYYSNAPDGLIPADQANDMINQLIGWENQNFGYNKDTGARDTGRMIEQSLNLRTKTIDNPSENDLKDQLLQNRVVLLPVNAQGLDHPNYQQGETIYHMVVVRGYGPEGFIIHDPGTDNGRDNIYTYAELIAATADWNNDQNVLAPETKVALSVWK